MTEILIDRERLKALGVRLLVLFGSRAHGAERPGSDVDLGFLLAPRISDRALAFRGEILDAIHAGAEPDLVCLDEVDPLLLFEVATSGRPLYEDYPGAFEEFRVRAVKRFYDTAWIRKIEAEALRRRYA